VRTGEQLLQSVKRALEARTETSMKERPGFGGLDGLQRYRKDDLTASFAALQNEIAHSNNNDGDGHHCDSVELHRITPSAQGV
jgi:hypothetical protein